MKFILLLVTTFAALASTGSAANLRDNDLHDASATIIHQEAPADMIIEKGADNARRLLPEEPVLAQEESSQQAVEDEKKNKGKRDLKTELEEPQQAVEDKKKNNGKRGLKKEYSGQGCRFCCDDDYHC